MADWIIAVDDDISNLKMAGHILSKAGFRVTALKSGHLLMEYVQENGYPDLILMDIRMPDMDGFEVMRRLREDPAGEKVPVIFLTGEEGHENESKSLSSGAMDYIRKPFNPEVLVSRVRKTLDIHNEMLRIEKDAVTDQLTGLLNKTATENRMAELCSTDRGLLCVLDLDAFKSVNDLYGHDAGDRILVMFSKLLKQSGNFVSACGRIGGDEFLIFSRCMSRSEDLTIFAERINADFRANAVEILGSNMTIPLGISIGAVAVPKYGTEYAKLFHLADQSLYFVKKNGKHGCRLYEDETGGHVPLSQELDLETITAILEEKRASPNAMWIGREVFGSIYRYMVRYMDRYHSSAYRVLYTVRLQPDLDEMERTEVLNAFKMAIRNTLRNSDVMMECGEHQIFLLLPEIQDYDIDRVLDRVMRKWKQSGKADKGEVSCEFGAVHATDAPEETKTPGDWVVVVDDDAVCRKMACGILEKRGIRVTALSSGSELVTFLQNGNRPSLVLLDLMMPEMDGFETMEQIRQSSGPDRDVPVIFLTADDTMEAETRALKLGALDFLKKPFSPEIMTLRVRHTLDLVHLQEKLTATVERKTQENEKLSLHVVQTLAEAIDAKDRYTKGHSGRVAEYAREIGKRFGYTWGQQNEIYMLGLLHDVGKIGIPDAIINKPGALTPEEYDVIKTHSATGAKILMKIEEMPRLTEAARWHHERYDGHGYPDGLSGEEIPEHARIIAVADAYDAMSSDRSYRKMLPQDKVKEEIEKGKGTQFDPTFADIMLDIIAEDREYRKRGTETA